MQHIKQIIAIQEDFARIDTFLSKELNLPKNQILGLIKHSLILINDKICHKGGIPIKKNDQITILNPKQPIKPQKETKTHLDIEIIYEDDDILILNKPSNLVVHGAPSVKDETLVDWLKAKNFTLSNLSGEERYGIVHRLDKDTTGGIIIAKNNISHANLSMQLQSKTLGRYYLAIIDCPIKDSIIVECQLGRNPKNRLKMTKLDHQQSITSRYSKSLFIPLLTNEQKNIQLIAVKLFTGRTHQIRAHLESISRHIIGDQTYGYHGNFKGRILLHAYLIYLIHPTTKKNLLFKASIFDDMLEFLETNFGKEKIDEILQKPEFLLNIS